MFFKSTAKGLQIEIYLQPKSSRNEVVGLFENSLKIKVQSPPVDGAANLALIKFLSEILEVPKSSLHLVKGSTSRHKTVLFVGDDELVVQKLKSLIG